MSKFEDILKDKLYNAKAEVPDRLWENISQQIPVERNRSGRIFWLSSILFFVIASIGMIRYYPSWNKNESLLAENELSSSSDFNFVNPIQDFFQSDSEVKSPPTAEHNSNVDLEKLNSGFEADFKNLNTGIENNLSSPAIFSLTENGHEFSSSNIFNAHSSSVNELDKTLSKSLNEQKLNLVKREDLISKEKIERSFSSSVQQILHSHGQRTLTSLDPSTISITQPKKKTREEFHCVELNGKANRLYLAARHISSYAFSSFDAKNDAAEPYLEKRLVSESKKYSFSDEVSVGLEMRKGMFTEVGLRYDQINEKFSYIDPNALHNTTIITIDTVISALDTTVVVDTVNTVLPGIREIVHQNRYKRLSVPLSFGYQYEVNRHLSLAVKAGLVVNVWSSNNGKIFNEEFEVIDIESRKNSEIPIYRNLIHSVSASLYGQYRVNKFLELTAGLNSYRFLGSGTHSSYSLDQRYTSLGLFVGAKYHM